jgi:hypothetical protein
MEADSEGTVAAWQDAREEVIKPLTGKYSGKIVKLTGNGFLVEFPTVQDAVNCAIAMQNGLASSPLDFRMGVNLGDIIDDGEDIHGEGVNVAARLEGLAEPGKICISGDVYNQVRNRVDANYEDMGEREVKHVSARVRAYQIGLDTDGTSDDPATPIEAPPPPPHGPDDPSPATIRPSVRKTGFAAGIVFVILAAAIAGWFLFPGPDQGFAGKTLHGVTGRGGQPFVMSLASGGRADLRLNNHGTIRRDVGKWWVNELGLFCYQYTQLFGHRKERCLVTEQKGQTRVAIARGASGNRWEFREDKKGIDQPAPELVGPRGLTASQIFANTDRDGDGRLTKDEFRGSPRAFPLVDANNDGFLTKQELEIRWRQIGGQ